ncbi:MAG: ABC1 kinase family protein [Rhodospirillales bacterium]|jgi:predicted unusual protein kinase regulating ubiquinone biosynthesis (AarF/ABC1/UbiB family)
MAQNDSLGGRVLRYTKVGKAVGGLAARLAGERYLGLKIDRLEHAVDLKDALGGLKGPLMKIAQILSTIPNALPHEYADQLSELQSNAPAMGWRFVKRRMAGELGANWASKFAEFDQEASAAASLGQVHKATAKDGRKIACKLQYPDMKSVVEADLKQLKLVFNIYRRYDQAIDPTAIYEELSARLREELDYVREAKQMQLYRNILSGEEAIHVPEVVDSLCGERLVSMTWLEGLPLKRYIDVHGDPETRNKVALNMFRAWYAPLYCYGVIHGDPHLGNYTVRDDGSINLMDFGCIRVFGASFVKGVIDLYMALKDNNPDLAVHAYKTWGFDDLTKEKIDILNMWARFVYGPLLEDRVRSIQTGDEAYGQGIARKVREELHKIGGVEPPPEFVLMDRAAIGLGSVFTHLNAEINWHQRFHELIDGFDEEKLAKDQVAALRKVNLHSFA